VSIPTVVNTNPDVVACRTRYQEIVKALSEDVGAFAVRLEIKLDGNGGCTLLATTSAGSECDQKVCELAVTLIQALTGVKADP